MLRHILTYGQSIAGAGVDYAFGRANQEVVAFSDGKGSVFESVTDHNIRVQKNQTVSTVMDQNSSLEAYKSISDPTANTFFKFAKISTVDYSKFLAQLKNKFIFVSDRNFAELYFRDKNVGYGEVYEYKIEAVSKEPVIYPLSSNSILVAVEDNSPAAPPLDVSILQTKETNLTIRTILRPGSNAARILIYKREFEQGEFKLIANLFRMDKYPKKNPKQKSPPVVDSFTYNDSDIKLGKRYFYRIFVINIYGIVSEPVEKYFHSAVQKITPQTRSNTLKNPIISVEQDSNSNFIKVNIFPNDSSINYYVLERKDLTIKEKKFSVPSKIYTNYGGNGWGDDGGNKFLVEKQLTTTQLTNTDLVAKFTFKPIQFLDKTVEKDHIYQYRVIGYDLFGNNSSAAFAYIKSSGKRDLRYPINIRREVIRNYPTRYKISWDDDNLKSVLESNNLLDQTTQQKKKIVYRVERRKINDTVYEKFPLTENTFIIDELPALDAINFDGQILSNQNSFEKLGNEILGEQEIQEASKIRRSFGIPSFLSPYTYYYYKITAISGDAESNASPEFEMDSFIPPSPPQDFRAFLVNAQVRPLSVKLVWFDKKDEPPPDYWIIERKIDGPNEIFQVIGKTYLENEFLDYNIQIGYSYVYRVSAYNIANVGSDPAEARLNT